MSGERWQRRSLYVLTLAPGAPDGFRPRGQTPAHQGGHGFERQAPAAPALPRPLSRAEQVVNGYARNLVDEVAKAVGSLKGRRRTRADRTTEVLKDALAPRSTGLAPGRHR